MLLETLSLDIVHALVVFARLGAMVMVAPGFSASYVSTRVRVLIACALTLVMAPALGPGPLAMPLAVVPLARTLCFEVFYGVFLGMIAQGVMAALHMAATFMSQGIGLMNAMVFDPVTAQQGSVMVGLLTNAAIVCVFIADLHHVALRGVMMSYDLFPMGLTPLFGDHLAVFTDTLVRSWHIGLRLASPFAVFTIVFQSVMGVMARLSPQMNVFFVALPVQILFGIAVLWIALPTMILWFLHTYENTLLTLR